jgi:hypothetical protein
LGNTNSPSVESGDVNAACGCTRRRLEACVPAAGTDETTNAPATPSATNPHEPRTMSPGLF